MFSSFWRRNESTVRTHKGCHPASETHENARRLARADNESSSAPTPRTPGHGTHAVVIMRATHLCLSHCLLPTASNSVVARHQNVHEVSVIAGGALSVQHSESSQRLVWVSTAGGKARALFVAAHSQSVRSVLTQRLNGVT